MFRSESRDSSDRVGLSLSPVTVTKTNVDPKLQEAELGLPGKGNKATEIAVQYPYGDASRVHSPSKDEKGVERAAESHILTAAGNRSHGVALPPVDRRFPSPVKLAEGERCNFAYSADGKSVSYTHYKVDGSSVHKNSAGATTTHDKDGNITHTNKSGGLMTLDKDGNIIHKPGGSGKIMMG